MNKGEKIKHQHLNYNMQSWTKQAGLNPIAVEKSDGIYMWDYDGKRYSDMSAQLVNLNLGHNNKVINEAIKAQVDKNLFLAPFHASEPRGELAEKLVSLLPDEFGKVFFTNSGAEGNENALKIAKMYTGRQKVFSAYRSYHGATYGAAQLNGENRRFPSEMPGASGFVKFHQPYLYRSPAKLKTHEEEGAYCLERLEEQIIYEGRDKVAAIWLETVVGSNGILVPPPGFLAGVRKLCDKYGILMVLDEVMSGFGRTGKMFAFEHWDVLPDLIVFAKGATCGYVPLGGVILSKKIAKHFDETPFMCGLTFSGHPLACATGVACIDYYEKYNVFDNVNKVGKVLGELLEGIKAKYDCVGDARYIGLFSCLEFVKSSATKEPLTPFGGDQTPMKKILGMLRERGFCTYNHENMIHVSPPLIITEEQMREEIAKLDEVCGIVQKEMV